MDGSLDDGFSEDEMAANSSRASFHTDDHVGNMVAHLKQTSAATWVTRQGERIAVKDMEYRHVLMTISMMMRYGLSLRARQEHIVTRAMGLGMTIKPQIEPAEPVEVWLRKHYPVFTSLEAQLGAAIRQAHRVPRRPKKRVVKRHVHDTLGAKKRKAPKRAPLKKRRAKK